MLRRCRLCKKIAVEESMFCDEHHSQAQLFSASFGQTGPDERAADEPRRRSDEESQKTASETDEEDTAEDATTVAPDSPDETTTILAEKVEQAYDRIRERAQEGRERDAARWPQISVYCLHDKVLARPYYTIIPHDGGDQDHATFEIVGEEVRAAIAAEGPVFAGLLALFKQNEESLKNRWLRSLDLHFLTYAGIIAINEHLPNQDERNLVTFALGAGGFEPIEMSAIKSRLRHQRW